MSLRQSWLFTILLITWISERYAVADPVPIKGIPPPAGMEYPAGTQQRMGHEPKMPKDKMEKYDKFIQYKQNLREDAPQGNWRTPAIVNHEFPWTVALNIISGRGPSFCSGVLLGPRFVLTSAYCIDLAVEIEVVLGAYNVEDKREHGQIRMKSREFFPHEEWQPTYLKNDLGLVRLPANCKFSETIQPIKIWPVMKNWVGFTSNVTGWGKANYGPSQSDELRYLTVSFEDDDVCIQQFYNLFDHVDHFCIGGFNGKMCKGDEGGPLTYFSSSEKKMFLIGIATFGSAQACGTDKRYPMVYTQIYRYRDWILRYTPDI